MASQNPHIEYILTESDYQTLLTTLPATGTNGQTVRSGAVKAFQYRQNVSDTVNAGKWRMWGIAFETFDFIWQNGAWQPPKNLVVREA